VDIEGKGPALDFDEHLQGTDREIPALLWERTGQQAGSDALVA